MDFEELLKQLVKEKGGTPEDYKRLLNLISFHETGGTMDPTTIQRSDKTSTGRGPGRGKYQFEGSDGSNRLLTAANRTANYYKKLGKPVPEEIKRIQSGDIYDATQLHPELQDTLVLGDLRMKGGLDLKDYTEGRISPEDLWVDHWWSGSQEKRPQQREKFVKDMKRYDANFQNPQSEQVEVASEKPVQNKYGQDFTQSLNLFRYGGNTNIMKDKNEINMFNEGGSHESNPLGGIPQGMGQNGQPNTVEEGEGRMDDMIYSDRIPLTEEAIMAVGLPKKFAGKTPAQALAEIEKTFKDRGDKSAQETKKDFADKIAQAQEMIKEQQAQIDQAMAANSQEVPDQMGGQIPAGMEEFVQPEQEGLPMEQDGRLQSGMQEQPQIFRTGGKMNRYFGGGSINVNMESEDMSGIDFGQGLGNIDLTGVIGAGTTALNFGNQIFGKSGIDTSGKTNYQERFKSGAGIASNALSGASTGAAFGPLGAGIGAGVGAIAGIFGGNKKKKDLIKAERNNTLVDSAQMRSDFKYGGKITDLIQKQFEKPTGDYMDYNRTSKEKDFWNENNKDTVGFINSMLVPNKEKDFWNENSDSLGFLNSMIVPSKNNNFKYGGKINKYALGGDKDKDKSYYPDDVLFPEKPKVNSVNAGIVAQGHTPFTITSANKDNLKKTVPIINPSMQIGFPNQGYYSTPDGKTQGQNPNSISNTGNLDKAGRIGNALLRGAPVGMNLLQLKNAGKYDTVNPIRNTTRFNPQYIDEKSLQNIADQSMNKTINAVSEMGGSKGQMISNIKDIGKNRAETLGKSYLDSKYKNIQTDTFSQQFDNQNTEANIARQIGAEDRTAMNKGAALTNKSRLLAQIGQDLGNIGKENVFKEIAKITGYNWLGEYMRKNPNASPEEIVAEAQKHVAKEEPTTNASAYGGKLKLKRY